MNLRGYILGTVAANLALVGALLWQAARMPAPSARGGVSITTNVVNEVVSEVVSEVSPRPAVVSVPGSPPFRWSQLETTNHAQFLTNLLAIGCPPETARDILEARVADDFRARLRELTLPLQTRFWDLTAADREFGELFKEPELEKQIEALKAERKRAQAELNALLPREDKSSRPVSDEKLAHLSPDKLAQLKALERHLAKERAEIEEQWATLSFREVPVKRKERHELEDAKRRALLTDDEWDEAELRRSQQARQVRELRGFGATAEELKSLARTLREFDTANPQPILHPNRAADDPDFKAKLDKREAQRKAFLTARLGEAGSAAFERGSDPRFHTLLKLARRLELAPDAAAQWLAVQSIAQERSSKLREISQLDDADRARLLLAIRAETERTLQAAVGVRGWGAYQRHAGDWLKQLKQLEK